jgi:hypothetical protein
MKTLVAIAMLAYFYTVTAETLVMMRQLDVTVAKIQRETNRSLGRSPSVAMSNKTSDSRQVR